MRMIVGQKQSVCRIPCVVDSINHAEGIDVELYKEVDGDRGAIRVYDTDIHDVFSLTVYPTFAMAQSRFSRA